MPQPGGGRGTAAVGTSGPGLAERGFDVSVLTLDGRGVYFEDLLARGVPIACAGLRHRADPIGLARAVRLAGPRSSPF